MIAEVEDLLSVAVPRDCRPESPTVVRVHTTRPVFLIFDGRSDAPVLAIQIGPRGEFERIHELLKQLQPRLVGVVPRSIACVDWRERHSAHVQSGLAGVPWFQVRAHVRGAAAWAGLRGRLLDTLARLHASVQSVREWQVSVHPAEELDFAVKRLRSAGPVPPSVAVALDIAAGALRPLGRVQSHWQHGDLCLNNVLVDREAIRVIDFEEFGRTSMPLDDRFGLAMSLHEMGEPIRPGETLEDVIQGCVAPALVQSPALRPVIRPLFLHHVVDRINECHDRPTRTARRQALWRLLGDVAADPALLARVA